MKEFEVVLGVKTLYQIQGHVIHHTNDKDCVSCQIIVQVPTFYLDANVQGIRDETHAVMIAKKIVCPVEPEHESIEPVLTATKVNSPQF